MKKSELNVSDDVKNKIPEDAKDFRLIEKRLYFKAKFGGEKYLITYIEI